VPSFNRAAVVLVPRTLVQDEVRAFGEEPAAGSQRTERSPDQVTRFAATEHVELSVVQQDEIVILRQMFAQHMPAECRIIPRKVVAFGPRLEGLRTRYEVA
jgi:hypothetical protein